MYPEDCKHPHLSLEQVGQITFYQCDACKKKFSANLKPFTITVQTPSPQQ